MTHRRADSVREAYHKMNFPEQCQSVSVVCIGPLRPYPRDAPADLFLRKGIDNRTLTGEATNDTRAQLLYNPKLTFSASPM